MFKWQTIVVLLLLGIINVLQLVQCEKTSSIEPEMKAAIAKGNALFAINLYKKLSSEGPNILFSPFSISIAMGIALLGASGDTHTQIKVVMGLSQFEDDEKLHKDLGFLSTELGANRANATIYSVNKVIFEKSLKFNEKLSPVLDNYYGVSPSFFDFRNSASTFPPIMNEWINTATRGKISNLISKDDISNVTRLILINAVYLKSPWMYQFNAEDTISGEFKTIDEETVRVSLMHINIETKRTLVEEINASAFWLPCAEDGLSMVILFPTHPNGLNEMENKFTWDLPTLLKAYKKNSEDEEFQLYMPKFQLDEKVDLQNVFKSMGIRDAFTSLADFSAFADANLSIGKILHQSKIEINEEGAEAAGFTVVEEMYRIGDDGPVVLNRPFVFLILDDKTDSILFLGRVGSPK